MTKISKAMDCCELLELRRHCRRNPEIRANAALLFAEICDYHMLDQGCIARDTTLAERLNCTPRAVRNWRRELKKHGYLEEGQRGTKRLLTPRWPKGEKPKSVHNNNRNDGSTDRNERSTSRNIHSTDRNNGSKKTGTNVPTQRDNIFPEGREGARVKDSDPESIAAFVDVIGRRPTNYEADRIRQRVNGAYQLFRKACQESMDNLGGNGDRVALGILFKQYDRLVEQKKRNRTSRTSGYFGSGMTDFTEQVRQEREAAHA